MGEPVDAADLGNFTYFTYGFFGASMGISSEVLYTLGGVTDYLFEGNKASNSASKFFEAFDKALNDPDGRYGDKEEDYTWVKKGVECYYNMLHTGW